MANHKSAQKAHRQSLERAARNKSRSSRIKTFIKKLEALISSGKKDEIATAFQKTESEIMKGVTKGIFKLNTASRKVSQLSKKVKAVLAA